VMCLAPGVQATVIFDNFDSGGGFSPWYNDWAAYVSDGTPIRVLRTAAEFTVTGGDFTLGSITLPISVGSGVGDDNPNPYTLRVRLCDDSSGAPGSTMEVLSQNQSIWPPTVVTVPSTPFTTKTTLTSANHPLLDDGGKYWIVTEITALPAPGTGGIYYRWYVNTSNTTVPFRQQIVDNALPADPWTGSPFNQNVAFEVEGTIVPIPASLWLLGSGFLGLAGLGRCRKS
jgi:hypothetical protein